MKAWLMNDKCRSEIMNEWIDAWKSELIKLNNKDLIHDGMIYVKLICKLINEWMNGKCINERLNELMSYEIKKLMK